MGLDPRSRKPEAGHPRRQKVVPDKTSDFPWATGKLRSGRWFPKVLYIIQLNFEETVIS